MTQLDCEQLVKEGLRLHEAGDLAGAEVIYRKVLESDHNHAGALHLLGVVAFQLWRLDSAEELIRRALQNAARE